MNKYSLYKKMWYERNKDRILKERKIYNVENRNVISQKHKIYYLRNRESIRRKKKLYYQRNRQKIYRHVREKMKSDTNFKLAHYLRGRMSKIINRNSKVGSAVKDLGCSVCYLKKYLETKFKSGMKWSNWSPTGWHIDHIKPLSKFDLTDRKQFLEACHYTNLQPLWASDNYTKGNNLI